MMKKKIIAINGSPRQNGNTAEILRHALNGAEKGGAETELIHLGALTFSGCKSCFSCKLKNGKSYGKCALNDDLTPVLDAILSCDGLLIGTPVYFGGESGLCRNLIERLLFPCLRYDAEHSSLTSKKFPLALVYTMNVPADLMEKIQYPEHFGMLQKFTGRILGNTPPEILYVCDTFQFSDYSLYDAPLFDPVHKKEVRESRFPEDCRKAFAIGEKFAGMA